MTMHTSLHTGSAAHPVLSALDGRLDQAGLIAPDPTTGVRLGVMYPEIGGFTVTGTSSTSPWQYSVPAATFVTSKGTLDGPRVGTNDAPVLVSTIAPPASNSRYDVIYVMQQDADATISPDASTAPLIGVVNGTAAASPTIPTIPVGAYQLAHALVASTATSGTSGAGVTITQDWQWTVPAGVPIPTRTLAERNAITWGTAAAPADVNRLDTGNLERNSGSGFMPWNNAAENQPTSETVISVGSGGETLVATVTITGAPAGTYVAIGAITAYTSGSTVAGYARFYKGATLVQERRNDLLAGAGPTQDHACLITHTGGDLQVGIVVYCASAYNVQPKGCSIVLFRGA